VLIDLLSPADLDSISDVYSHAFSPEEAPLMDKLTRDLLEIQSTPETLCLGLRVDDRLIAVMGLSPIEFVSEAAISGYILAPLAVHAEFQGRGYARKLIEGGIQQLSHQGCGHRLCLWRPRFLWEIWIRCVFRYTLFSAICP